MAITPRKTFPELAALTAPVVDSDVVAVYRSPGPAKRTTASVFSDYIKAFFSASSGSSLVGFLQAGTGAVTRTMQDKARERVSITDFGAVDGGSAAVNTAALHAAMKYQMDRFPGAFDFYPAGPGDPTTGGLVDFERTDRRTGVIYIPSGLFKLLPDALSSLVNARAPFVGFTFQGEDQSSSVLMLETGGVDSWLYQTSAGQERYQKLVFENLTLMSDDYEHGSLFRVYSTGTGKQFTVNNCRVRDIQTYMLCEGTGNADLNRVTNSWLEHYGPLLILDNDQAVQHDFIGCHFRSWGSHVHVKQAGGGNVNFTNGAGDFTWDERHSDPAGTFLFTYDANAVIGQGNCTFSWKNIRMEVEAYMTSAGAPPFGLVNCPENPSALPQVLFDNVNFVNGKTYAINGSGTITGEAFRRITAVKINPGKHVEFRNCVMLKNFFYNVSGSIDTDSPPFGGIIKLVDCYDGIVGELPPADSALSMLHRRVTYSGTAGRVITEGMTEHTTGSSTTRVLLDADPNWRNSFGREPASTVKTVSFKHTSSGWPFAANATNDIYLDLPPTIIARKILILMPASGAVTNAYQLDLFITNRAGPLIGSSTPAQFKDAHVIEFNNLELTGVSRLCLAASGTGTDFRSGGYAFIEYV